MGLCRTLRLWVVTVDSAGEAAARTILVPWIKNAWNQAKQLRSQHIGDIIPPNLLQVKKNHACQKNRHSSKTLAEKVLFRQIRQIGAKRDRLLHSCFIARRVGRRGFSARV